jgi:hypothetical protein
MLIKIALSASAAAASLMLLPTAASAGEVTGNGKDTGMEGHAASVCAFSGQEDSAESPLRTQTPHEVYFDIGPGPAFVLNPPPGSPGTACNPAKADG